MLRKRHNDSIHRSDSQQAVKSPPLLVSSYKCTVMEIRFQVQVHFHLLRYFLFLQESPDSNREIVKLSVSKCFGSFDMKCFQNECVLK